MHSIQTTSVNKTSLKYQNIQLKKKNQKLQKEKLDLEIKMAAIMSKNNIQDVSLMQITSELEEKKKELKIKNDEIDRLKEKEIGMLKQEIEILTQENRA